MKIVVPFLFCFFSLSMQAQTLSTFTAQSSCIGGDSITKIYKRDADRLTIRHSFDSSLTWKDSVRINKVIAGKFLKALLAVYNATTLPVRDSVVKILNIHAPQPEMNNFQVKAPSNLLWMQKLLANQLPTNDPFVDNLLNTYSIQPVNYYQSNNYDVAVFKTDSNYNLTKLCAEWAALNMVIGAEALPNTNPVFNIMGQLAANSVSLTYEYNYGTCEDGCDYKLQWHFIIDLTTCIVSYTGWTGNQLSLQEQLEDLIAIYPNPTTDFWHMVLTDQTQQRIELYTITGQLVSVHSPAGPFYTIDSKGLAKGIYFVKITTPKGSYQAKLIKQ